MLNIGDRFGRSSIVCISGTRTIGKKIKRTYTEYKMICDCGQEYFTTEQHLVIGKSNSCGCIRRKDLSNQYFGMLKVISYNGTGTRGKLSKRKVVLWNCLCDCGNVCVVCSEYLTTGQKTSCGCKKGLFILNPTNNTQSITRYLRRIKNEKRRNKKYELTDEYCANLLLEQNYRCKLSGLEISLNKPFTASLDRIDSNLGYIEGNVQWLHRNINYMKNSLPQSEFIKLCSLVSCYNHFS